MSDHSLDERAMLSLYVLPYADLAGVSDARVEEVFNLGYSALLFGMLSSDPKSLRESRDSGRYRQVVFPVQVPASFALRCYVPGESQPRFTGCDGYRDPLAHLPVNTLATLISGDQLSAYDSVGRYDIVDMHRRMQKLSEESASRQWRVILCWQPDPHYRP